MPLSLLLPAVDLVDAHHRHSRNFHRPSRDSTATSAAAFDCCSTALVDIGRPAFGYEPFDETASRDALEINGFHCDDDEDDELEDEVEVIETICDNCSRSRTLESTARSAAVTHDPIHNGFNNNLLSASSPISYIQAIQSRLSFLRFFRVFVSRSGRKKVMLKEQDEDEEEDAEDRHKDMSKRGFTDAAVTSDDGQGSFKLLPL